ncbi:MAG: protein-glutamate methylesterase/protein-glutamine glutaminase [Limnochordia bacterium]|jgi:two-component system chemotaxis response regulator CheB
MLQVMVVDDSAFMRRVVSDILNSDPELRVVATARNGQEALEQLDTISVDVITLDVEMPHMNGLDFLRELMTRRPLPVVMLSSLTMANSQTTLEALSLGAVDFVAKPGSYLGMDAQDLKVELISKVKAAALAKVFARPPRPCPPQVCPPSPGRLSTIVAIGASTGGPRALEAVLAGLPGSLPAGLLITQHMPPGFTTSFAQRLDRSSSLKVREAQEGDTLRHGTALIAPGDYHLLFGSGGRVRLNQGERVEYVRPSVDVMVDSIVQSFRGRLVGVIMTGMGRDGARGMEAIKARGGYVIAQDEATSTIFSMPRAVIEAGLADEILPLEEIAPAITRVVRGE